MLPNPREELTPGLLRQLSRIEQLGNAEAALAHEERIATPATQRRAPGPTEKIPDGTSPAGPRHGSIAESQHRRLTTIRRARREARRARQFSITLLLLFPIFTAGYVVAGYYGRGGLALILLLLGGLTIGFALPTLYLARQRQERLDREA